jgi:hypothetical protein
VTKVNSNEFTKYFGLNTTVDQTLVEDTGRYVIFYEVDPIHKTSFPSTVDKYDSNNGIDDIFTRLICGVSSLSKQ